MPAHSRRKEIMSTVTIRKMLCRLGVREPEEQTKAVAALQQAGVISSRPNRTGIASDKEGRVRESLQSAFMWHCRRGDCQREAKAFGKFPLLVDAAACHAPVHSPRNQRLADIALIMQSRNMSNILIVGGTEKYQRELLSISPDRLSWRFVDGKKVKDARFYQPHKAWAHLIVIWASTPLDHKVSQHFQACNDARVITAPGRGIEAMLQDVLLTLAPPAALG